MRKVFITGVTGVVGSSVLMELLLSNDIEIHVLIRKKKNLSAEQRFDSVCNFLSLEKSKFQNRVFVHDGDIEDPQLGLPNETRERIAQDLFAIVHCAASVDLTRPTQIAVESALKGTQEIIDLLTLAGPQCRLEYVSTVGVKGKSLDPLVEERVLGEGPFFNSYEHSKAKAELEIYKAQDRGIKINIHRPSMVVGNSQSGQIIHFQVFYFITQLMTGTFTKGLLCDVFSHRLDTVPSDLVAKVIHRSLQSERTGQIYHISTGPQSSITLGEIREMALSSRRTKGLLTPRLILIPSWLISLVSQVHRLFPDSKLRTKIQLLPQFLEYASSDQNFSSTKTREIFSELPWPQPKEYLKISIDYYYSKLKR